MIAACEVPAEGTLQDNILPTDDPGPCCPTQVIAGGRQSVRGDLRASLADGGAYGITVGIGENFMPAFVLAIGMGEVAAGLMATVPMLAGALLQLASPLGVRWLRSHRAWVVACAAAQATSLLLLPIVALAGASWGGLSFVAATFYWGAGLATGPAWSTWMEDLVPGRIRAQFFGRRSRFYQLGMIAGFLAGGAALQAGTSVGHVVWGFAGLFVIAAASRYASTAFLIAHREGTLPRDRERSAVREAQTPAQRKSFLRLLAFLMAMQAAVYASGPYFTPYMLTVLQFGYLQYALLITLGLLGKALFLPVWGRMAQRTGARRLLWIGGAGIVPFSALWIVSDHMAFLIGLQLTAGAVWGAFELATLLIFFEAIPRQQRLRLMTLYNVGNSAAMVAGSLIGAVLLKWLGTGRDVYFTLFALSTVARAGSLLFLLWVPATRSQRHQRPVSWAVQQPSDGSETPVVAGLPHARQALPPSKVPAILPFDDAA